MSSPHPYPTYKPSGVPWLGDVPAHWEVIPGRACYTSKQILNHGMLERTVLSLSYGQIKVRPEEKLHGLVPESFETYQLVEPGDIICRPTDLQNDWNSLRFGLSPYNGIITSAYMCFRTSVKLSRRYGHLLLHTYDLKKVFYGLGSGLRQNLSWTDFKLLPCLVPSLPEQRAIVRYLDYVDRRIRRYVSAKRRLIALLEEEKQAIVNRAVTRGFDPNVCLKPSGVKWLGDVPEHWERRRLKMVIRAIDRRSTSGSETLLSLRRDHGVVVYAEHFKRPSQSRSLVGFKLVGAGQLVVNRLQANNGLIFNSTVDGLVSPDYSVFEGRSPIDMKFLSDLLRTSSYRAYFRQNATGLGTGTAGFLRLYDDTLLETPVYLPHVEEQSAIVERMDKTNANIDAAISRARRQIDLVQEYRTRLIADVVTGKLDVRESAVQLPDEADDQDPTEGSDLLTYGLAGDRYDIDESAEDSVLEQKVTA